MFIEKNLETQLCTIWVERERETEYKSDNEYLDAVRECKENGMSVCVFVGGDMPIVSVIDEALSATSIIS